MSLNSSFASSVSTCSSYNPSPSNYGSPTQEAKSPISLVLTNWNGANHRDKASYPILKSERAWDAFQRKLIIQLQTDGCKNILDHTWKPADSEQKELDALQNNFLSGVLEHVLLTDLGKSIIRTFMDNLNFDARLSTINCSLK